MSFKSNIPSDEDFKRASRLMKERSSKLDAVRDAVRSKFKLRGSLHDFFILDQMDVDFRAYVFFQTNDALVASERNGLRDEIVDYVYSELARVGRGGRGKSRVAFEFDTDENVTANFGGDYYLRIH